jgi:hypothetical protein
MFRTAIVRGILIAGLLTSSGTAAGRALMQAAPAGQATAADAAPFVGEWTLALNGDNGAATFDLAVKIEKDKVIGEIAGMGLAAQTITDVTMAAKSLRLRYAFDYQGNSVDTIVSLTPAADGKVNAQMDFAAGAYVASGTATKKEKAK